MAAARRRVDRTNRDALTRMLRTTGLNSLPDEAPLVALLRRLAKKLDEGGGTRDEAMYLSALKDARKVLDSAPLQGKLPPSKARAKAQPKPAVKPADEKPADEADAPVVDDLVAFKQKRGIG
jgi:hypothetical protein